jgi:hypothetical protein
MEGWHLTGSCMCGGTKKEKYAKGDYQLTLWPDRHTFKLTKAGKKVGGGHISKLDEAINGL